MQLVLCADDPEPLLTSPCEFPLAVCRNLIGQEGKISRVGGLLVKQAATKYEIQGKTYLLRHVIHVIFILLSVSLMETHCIIKNNNFNTFID